jgi:dihydrodipicolinate synthase/N-acetylneuraminate lyase
MSRGTQYAIATGVAFLVLSCLALRGPVGVFLAIAVLLTIPAVQEALAWRDERAEHARLLREAQRQHAAWLAGDDDWGVYGISPTAPTERAA